MARQSTKSGSKLASFIWIGFCLAWPENHCVGQEKYELRTIKNSPTFSQVIDVNAKLETLGMKEVTEGAVSSLQNFFRSGDLELSIPVPKSFTSIEAQALSDNGLVVGYTSRPLGTEGGTIHSFVWSSKTKELVQLSPLPGDVASHAMDICDDGSLITGYSVGREPPSMRPCVWAWKADVKEWAVSELTSIMHHNPYLQASQVLISPDGKRIAACISEKILSEFVIDSSLYVWESSISPSGTWERQKISDEQPSLKDLNDEGVMVGSIVDDATVHAIRIDLKGKLERFAPLPGDATSVAFGISKSGVIIGTSDDPPGKDGGPQAFIIQKGQVVPLPLPPGTIDSAALTISSGGVIGGFFLPGIAEDDVTSAYIAIPKQN